MAFRVAYIVYFILRRDIFPPSSVYRINLSQESNLKQSIVQKDPLSGVCRMYELVSSAGHFIDEVLYLCLAMMGIPAYRHY